MYSRDIWHDEEWLGYIDYTWTESGMMWQAFTSTRSAHSPGIIFLGYEDTSDDAEARVMEHHGVD